MDIVEQLRTGCSYAQQREAASAIDRLRAERDKWMEYATGDRAELALKMETLRADLALSKKHAEDMNDGWRTANFENHDLRAELADAKAALTKYGDQGAFQALRDANARITELEDKLSTAVWSRDHERADNEALHKRIAELEAKTSEQGRWQELHSEVWKESTGVLLEWRDKAARAERAEARVAELDDLVTIHQHSCKLAVARAERAEARVAELEGQFSYWADWIVRAERAEAERDAMREALKDMIEITEDIPHFAQRARGALNPSPEAPKEE